jgi:hypothetical protein
MFLFFIITFYLQFVQVQSANCVKSSAVACSRVLSSTPLLLIGSRPVLTFGAQTYVVKTILPVCGSIFIYFF